MATQLELEYVPRTMCPVSIPTDSRERPFLEYWARHVLEPNDPQGQRWLDRELTLVDRGRELARSVERYAPIAGRAVLDLGCQTGSTTVAFALAGARVVGLDVTENQLEAARIRAGCYGVSAEFRVGRAEALPFAPASFDVVVFVDVIEHVQDTEAALAEIARVLRPGGTLYLQGPNRLSPRQFLRDPHYRMLGISVLPHDLGEFYVTRVRKFPSYDVGVFPIGARVVRSLRSLGMSIVHPRIDADAALLRRAWTAYTLWLKGLFTIVAVRDAP